MNDLVENLDGVKRVCRVCALTRKQKGELRDLFCGNCGTHYNFYGQHEVKRAIQFLRVIFKDQGFDIPDLHLEALYALARDEVRNGGIYMEVIEAALNAMKQGKRL